MQIPSSPNSSSILIRPEVLGINNGFFFFSLLQPLTSRVGTEEKVKALAEQRDGSFISLDEETPITVLSVGEANFYAKRKK